MGKHSQVKLLPGAVAKLLQSPEVRSDLERRGHRIAAAAGGEPDFEVVTVARRDRVAVSVVTRSHRARYWEATSRTLTRAIDAGR